MPVPRLLCLLMLTSLVPCAGAQEAPNTIRLSFREAIQQALAKNFEIRVEKFGPQIAEANRLSASGAFDPTIELSYTRSQQRQAQRTLATDVDLEPNQPDLFVLNDGDEFDSGIVGLAPWGLTYDLGASTERTSDSRNTFDRYETFAGIQVVQPVLRGFGTDVNLSQLRIARTDQAISEWELQLRVMEIITRTVRFYNELFFSIRNLQVEIRSRDLSLRLLQDNERRAEVGVMSPLDVLQAKADAAAREQAVLVAERAVANNKNFLKQLVTDETTSILTSTIQIEEPPPPPDTSALDPKFGAAHALKLRPDYRQALLELQKREINLVFTRNGVLPQLDLIGSFGLNGVDTTYAESFNRTGSGDNFSFTAGAIFSLPVPNREARGQRNAAQLQVAQALVALKQLEQDIYVRVDNAAGEVETTRKRIEAARVARILAEETLEAAQGRLASGTSTTFEVLQFQRDLAAAQISELRAVADHNIAIADYAFETGTTFEISGVRVVW